MTATSARLGDFEGAGAAYRTLAAARAAALGAGHAPRARSHCRVAPPLIMFVPRFTNIFAASIKSISEAMMWPDLRHPETLRARYSCAVVCEQRGARRARPHCRCRPHTATVGRCRPHCRAARRSTRPLYTTHAKIVPAALVLRRRRGRAPGEYAEAEGLYRAVEAAQVGLHLVCHFAPPLIHFIPGFLSYSVAVFPK